MGFNKLGRLQDKLNNNAGDDLSDDWWKNIRWNYGRKCKGWTIFQIFKIEPSYLRWIINNFQSMVFLPLDVRKAIYKAVEILDNRKDLEDATNRLEY